MPHHWTDIAIPVVLVGLISFGFLLRKPALFLLGVTAMLLYLLPRIQVAVESIMPIFQPLQN